MSEELKLCPFCGDEAAQYDSDGQPMDDWAQCYCSALDGRSVHASYWNTRPLEDALRAENAKLKARVEAAEELIEAQEEFDAAVGLPECWGDEKEYKLDVGKLTARLQAAREKWSALK